MIVISVERNRYILQRSNQTHAEAVLPSQAPVAGRLAHLWKSYQGHDADGNETKLLRQKASVITIVRVVTPIEMGEVVTPDVLAVQLEAAHGCGFRTVQVFRESWAQLHPRSPEAAIVWFAIGEWRDRDTFMNYSGRAGGDYTHNARRAMDSDAPVLTREEIDRLVGFNRSKDEARRAKASAALAVETLSQRLLRIERYIEWTRRTKGEEAAQSIVKDTRQEFRIVLQRLKRAEGRSATDEEKARVAGVPREE